MIQASELAPIPWILATGKSWEIIILGFIFTLVWITLSKIIDAMLKSGSMYSTPSTECNSNFF